MRYDLTSMARRAKSFRRSRIIFRDIVPPAMLAGELYRAAYLPVIDVLARAADRYAADAAVTLTRDTTEDVQAAVDDELTRLYLLITPRLRDWAVRVERYHRGKWRGAVLSATSVDIGTLIGPEDVRETLGNTIARNVALVKDVGAQGQSRMTQAVFDGLRERKPATEVAKDIREAVPMARRRARNVAADQLNKITSALADERRREAGLDKWEWNHSDKANPRPEHQARDGKVYSDANAPADRPGQLPYCGCRARAVMDLD